MSETPRKAMIRDEGEDRDLELPILPGDTGKKLTEWLREHELSLNTRCGEKGLCDGCNVALQAGRLEDLTGQPIEPSAPTDGNGDGDGDGSDLVRGCACRLPSEGDLRLRLPARSRPVQTPSVVANFKLRIKRAHEPLATPTVERPKPLGVAIDIGTTTTAVLLVDLEQGRVLAQASAFNRQIDFADNVLSRIQLCRDEEANVARLRDAVIRRTLRPLIGQALRHANARSEDIAAVTVAGNTTMLHLLVGVNPGPMGVAPFPAPFLEHQVWSDAELGLVPGEDGETPVKREDVSVHLLPGISAYVGADLTAGLVSCGMGYDDGVSVLLDVGTNGEMILRANGQWFSAATAAGPAFEGSGLYSGCRASRGAIDRIALNREPFGIELRTIEDAPAIGLCGTAYLDLLAEGVRTGLISMTGRYQPDEVPGAETYFEADKVGGQRLRLPVEVMAEDAGDGHGTGIGVGEVDIAILLQAKAAIGAGLITLLDEVGLGVEDVDRLYLAGGFGLRVQPASAIATGLLPGFTTEQIVPVGNTSLAGSYLALLDRGLLDEMIRLAGEIPTLELNERPSFEMNYVEQLCLPEPTVSE